jgi:peptide/nickel transport system ATP-binding protein
MAGTGTAHLRPEQAPILSVRDLVVEYQTTAGTVHAVSGISFDVLEGETLGIVGESGCGKSTAGRAVLQLPRPTSGEVTLGGETLTALEGEELRRRRSRIQMIFQDPISSLNPRRKVRDIVARGPRIWGTNEKLVAAKVAESLDAVGLDVDIVGDRRPGQFSGGQAQRICIARALVMEPTVLVCDEPVSALDVSVQAQIVNVLKEMRERYRLSLLFIAHDLAVIKNISDRVLVMYLGKVCEVAPSESLYESPAHHYTQVLLRAIPQPVAVRSTPDRSRTASELPSPLAPPSGCRFRTRCPAATSRCAEEEPVLREIGDGHYVACHFPTLRGEITS